MLRELTSDAHCFEVMVGLLCNFGWGVAHDLDQLFLRATLWGDGDISQVRSSQQNGNLFSACAKR